MRGIQAILEGDRVELRQLEYAVALAETLHFGQASAKLYIAQSAFSAQIARLEKEVGAQLFDRSSNRVAITAAGELFISRAQEILNQVQEASRDAASLHSLRTRQLKVGIFHEAAGELTPLIVHAYQKSYPDVELVFHELNMIDQIDAIVDGVVDVAFLRAPVNDRRIRLTALFAEPRFVGLSMHHHLARCDAVTMEDLMDESFVLASPQAPSLWRGYWAFDDVRGGPSRVATTVDRVWESVTAIAYHNAVDTFPGSATRTHHAPGMVYLPIKDSTYSTSAIAVRSGKLPLHVAAFEKVATDLARTSLSAVPGAVPLTEAPQGTPPAV